MNVDRSFLETLCVYSGVPQASVLEPLSFPACTNELFATDRNNINIRMFPDDCVLCSVAISQEEQQLINKALCVVED